MSSARSETLPKGLGISSSAAVAVTGAARRARAMCVPLFIAVISAGASYDAAAQNVFDPASEFGPFVQQATLTARGLVGSSGNALFTVDDGVVVVFERDGETDLWSEAARLTPSDGSANFGRAVAFDARTIIVGAEGAAYVFVRKRAGWREAARLVPSDDGEGFGRALAFDGRTVIVGAGGAAYLFRRDNARWRELAKLVPSDGLPDFGFSVALDGAQATVVGQGGLYVFTSDRADHETWKEILRLAPIEPGGVVTGGQISEETAILTVHRTAFNSDLYIFGRHQGGHDNWGLVKRLDFAVLAGWSLDGDTLIVGGGELSGYIQVFSQNLGGPNAWGLEASRGYPFPVVRSVQKSGNSLILRGGFYSNFALVLAQNEGGLHAWGTITQLTVRITHTPAHPVERATIDGDTALVELSEQGVVQVLVSDLDRDGLRDGRDPCPRDPFNNVAGRCQRASELYSVLDDLLTQGDVTSEIRGREQIITATFTNTSETAVQNPFFEVTELTGRNVLLNGDAGHGGVGATLSPDVGDGILSPGESMTVTFRIRLRMRDPFQLFVTFHGDPLP